MQQAERKQAVAEKEAKFMAALQRFVGPDVELTEDKVREVIQTLTPEQRQELMSEGQELKEELLTGDGHDQEVALFRKEVNDRAEKADLPVEKDGEHLTKKVRPSTSAPLAPARLARVPSGAAAEHPPALLPKERPEAQHQ